MTRSEFIAVLQEPFDWDLPPDETDLACELAKKHGGQAVVKAWHQYQKEQPCRTMQEFREWYEGPQPAAEPVQQELDLGNPFSKVYARMGRLR